MGGIHHGGFGWTRGGWIIGISKSFWITTALSAQVVGGKTLGSFWRLSWTTWMIGVGCGFVAALIMYLIVDLLISVFMGGSSASA